MSRHDYRQAQQAYQKASDLAPEDVGLLNTRATPPARPAIWMPPSSALRRYAALRPNEPNPLDSMGDVNLIDGPLCRGGELLSSVRSRRTPTSRTRTDS